MRRALLLCILLTACTQDPIRYIPAEERRAALSDGSKPISVDEMLSRIRSDGSGQPDRLLVRFDGAAIQPDAAQKASLRQFASAAQAAHQPLRVASRPGSFEDAGAPVLGQRRAVAVARELSAVIGDVEMKFDPALPPGVVVVTQGARP